jgi:hypothetical protein
MGRKESESGWGYEASSWVGIYIVVTIFLGFLFYCIAESPGYTGNLTMKKGDLTWFILSYLVVAFMFEWKRRFDNLGSNERVLWVMLWLYILAGGVFLIFISS